MRVASIGEGLVEIREAELSPEQYPFLHELRARANWIAARLNEARIPVTDPGTPPAP